jgi:hypothetical protein
VGIKYLKKNAGPEKKMERTPYFLEISEISENLSKAPKTVPPAVAQT